MLYCFSNDITVLDVTANPELRELHCRSNDITTLDVTHNQLLTKLDCSYNRITALNVRNNPALTMLYCFSNDITVLDVTANPELTELACQSNDLTALDVTNNQMLTILDCSYNRITALNVRDNQTLKELYCDNNGITTLDVTNNPVLTALSFCSNDIIALDVTNNQKLISLDCSYNLISALNVRNNPALTRLDCYSNYLTALDVTANPALIELSFGGNDITSINLYNNSALKMLWCYDDNLDTLDLSRNPDLEYLSCPYNNLKHLDLRNNPKLETVYCYNNQLTDIDLSRSTSLDILSCTDNQLTALDLSACPNLRGLDCSTNYITALDISRNPKLEILYCSSNLIDTLDLSLNTTLNYFDCSYTNITTVDLSRSTSLVWANLANLTMTQNLRISPSGREDYPYQSDIRSYVGNNYTRITGLTAHTKDGTEIPSLFTPSEGIAYFAVSPIYLVYDYPTGYTGTASEDYVPRTMNVTISVPRSGWIYLPKIETRIADPSDDMHPSERTPEHSAPAPEQAPEQQLGRTYTPGTNEDVITPTLPGAVEPEIISSDQNQQVPSSSGGGCDSLGTFAAIAVLCFLCRRRRRIFMLCIMLAACYVPCSEAQDNVNTADYLLPYTFEIYTPAGRYEMVSPEILVKFAEKFEVSEDKVHSYEEIALPGSWNFRPQDMYYLANNGSYGGVMLPVTEYMTSGDYYLIKCIFSNDIQPGELIGVDTFEVDLDTRDSFYDETKLYFSRSVPMDMELNQIEFVPEDRTIYIAVSIHTNTGVVSVARGEYVEETDPLLRLDAEVVQHIADELGIDSGDLKYITRSNMSPPREATEDMKAYIKSDDHEIVANFPTLSVDVEGIYIIPITLSGDVWEMLKSHDIADYKFYALNDSEAGSEEASPAFINGLISTWELFTLNGEKMTSFGVKEFLMVGFLNAGKPFSVYLARMIIMLLLGGCNSGLVPGVLSAVILGVVIIKFCRRR